MKYLSFTGILCLVASLAHAQTKIEKHINYTGKENIELNIQIADSIEIRTWNKNEVYVIASVNINNNRDNKAYETSFDETGKTVRVDARMDKEYFKGKNCCCDSGSIFWTVWMPAKSEIKVESINADLTLKGDPGKLYLKTISGFIDLAVSVSRPAALDFSTISGTIYSDFDIKPSKERAGIPVRIRQSINNGGPEIKLETISGDIFFRKAG
jgi:hypothetical protein